MLLGSEDLPTSTRRNKIMLGNSYSNKVLKKAIKLINNDKNR